VDEIPPAAKPDGGNVQWVSGYWHWDADRYDFIWVCGCYRDLPPERVWQPGRWRRGTEGWTYFPGYWRPTDLKSLPANLPEPPSPKADAATSPKDNPNAMWVPGVWQYGNGEFEWQPGYWPPSNGPLYWQQAQYVATETGFAFVPGHWDYPLEERGLLYSPVWFSPAQREKRGWAYRPESAIVFGSNSGWGKGGAFDSLLIGPNENSYVFGNHSTWALGGPLASGNAEWDAIADFVSPMLRLHGFGDYRPWYSVSREFTNPLWQYYLLLNRNDPAWAARASRPDASRPHGLPLSGTGTGTAATGPNGYAAAAASPVRPNRVINALAFVQPATQVLARQSARMISLDGGLTSQLVTKNTMAYQHISRRGVVTTGVMQYRVVSPPVYTGGYRR
jgi:hypothetical protein